MEELVSVAPVWTELPIFPDDGTVAYVIDPVTGELLDEAGGWEAAQNYVLLEGMRAIAVADDGSYWTVDRQQALYDAERARFIDCWG